ncbi:MAG: GNAT family N-acetyltransferase [Alphaproteobacteria bacterium]|nr:GNAT family N-acetyltransferase [Alphaproteobacteria bacterium]
MSELVYDGKLQTARLLAQKLGLPMDEFVDGFVFNIVRDGLCMGTVAYNDYRVNDSAWISIWTLNKKWCSAKILKQIFGVAFDALKCRRINALICCDNLSSISLAKRCGFVEEGKMHAYYQNGKDAYVLGMLRDDCKFLKGKEKKNV